MTPSQYLEMSEEERAFCLACAQKTAEDIKKAQEKAKRRKK